MMADEKKNRNARNLLSQWKIFTTKLSNLQSLIRINLYFNIDIEKHFFHLLSFIVSKSFPALAPENLLTTFPPLMKRNVGIDWTPYLDSYLISRSYE